ncbi:MAG: peptidase M14, partial [Microvirga sp.]
MTTLLDERIPRTLDTLLREWARNDHRGVTLEAWLFEDEAARRAAEAVLSEVGVRARLRSAYKPLVHTFLEEIDTADLKRITVRYPVHEEADRLRFLSEAYPLAALLDGIELLFEPGTADLTYLVMLEYASGHVAEHAVFAPNRLRPNHLDEVDLTPTGWLKVTGRPHGAPDLDEPLETEIEQVFHKVMAIVAAHDWPETEPYA